MTASLGEPKTWSRAERNSPLNFVATGQLNNMHNYMKHIDIMTLF